MTKNAWKFDVGEGEGGMEERMDGHSKSTPKDKMKEGGRNGEELVEVISKSEMGERWREGDGSVEGFAKGKVGE